MNRKLITEIADEIVADHDKTQHQHLSLAFRSMGASDEEIIEMGLEEQFSSADAETAQEYRNRLLLPASHTPFNNPTLRNWYFDKQREMPIPIPKKVDCRGYGPFEDTEFGSFLQDHKILNTSWARSLFGNDDGTENYHSRRVVAEVRSSTNVVVLGREGWTESELDLLIEEHVGKTLRIYSQEMFLSFLAAKRDPFDGGQDVLAAYRAGHPGLEFVSGGWPGWVTTFIREDRSGIPLQDGFAGEVEVGPLKALGYAVGQNGEEIERRHEILRNAFTGELPPVGNAEYMKQWGVPNSPTRLHKMADSISTFCRNSKMRNDPQLQAIADWELDLVWLKEQFYHGHFQFHWPETIVPAR